MKTFSNYINQANQLDEAALQGLLNVASKIGGVGGVGRFARGAMGKKGMGDAIKGGLSAVYHSNKPLSGGELAGNIAGSVLRKGVNIVSRFSSGRDAVQSGVEAAARRKSDEQQAQAEQRSKSRDNIKILNMKLKRVKDLHSRATTPDRKRVLAAIMKKTQGEIRGIENKLFKAAEREVTT